MDKLPAPTVTPPAPGLDDFQRTDADVVREVDAAAMMLTIRERTFCDMVLTKDVLGMTIGECYIAAGYDVPDGVTASSRANMLLDRRHPKRYILAVQARCMDDLGITVRYLDEELMALISADISDLVGTRGINRIRFNPETKQNEVDGVDYVPELRCNIDDLTPAQRRSVQSIEITTHGIKVKQYDRLAALKLAYQRLGALVERKEHAGPGGTPLVSTPLIHIQLVPTSGTESAPAYAAYLPSDVGNPPEQNA